MPPKASQKIVLVTTTGVQILQPDARRIGVVFGRPQTNRYTVSTTGVPVLDEGLTFAPNCMIPPLNDPELRGLAGSAWFAISAVANQNIAVFECFE